MLWHKKRKLRHLHTEENGDVIKKHVEGETHQEITDELGISKSTSQPIVSSFVTEGKINNAPCTGRLKKLSESNQGLWGFLLHRSHMRLLQKLLLLEALMYSTSWFRILFIKEMCMFEYTGGSPGTPIRIPSGGRSLRTDSAHGQRSGGDSIFRPIKFIFRLIIVLKDQRFTSSQEPNSRKGILLLPFPVNHSPSSSSPPSSILCILSLCLYANERKGADKL